MCLVSGRERLSQPLKTYRPCHDCPSVTVLSPCQLMFLVSLSSRNNSAVMHDDSSAMHHSCTTVHSFCMRCALFHALKAHPAVQQRRGEHTQGSAPCCAPPASRSATRREGQQAAPAHHEEGRTCRCRGGSGRVARTLWHPVREPQPKEVTPGSNQYRLPSKLTTLLQQLQASAPTAGPRSRATTEVGAIGCGLAVHVCACCQLVIHTWFIHNTTILVLCLQTCSAFHDTL